VSVPVIAITNQSSVLTDAEVKAVLPALQHQVTADFRAYWDIDATLIFMDKTAGMVAGWWQIVILDDADQADALGYHELSSVGTPLGKIFARLDKQSGSSWTVTLSHELLEMLGDPDIDTVKQAADGKFYALEVCDAVESDDLGYKIEGVLVSDFVTPKWFNDEVGNDRYSFKQRIKKPLELAPGGYISVYDGANGWKQLTAEPLLSGRRALAEHAQTIRKGSRRANRFEYYVNRENRRRSTR
jgi:hypothetical protein